VPDEKGKNPGHSDKCHAIALNTDASVYEKVRAPATILSIDDGLTGLLLLARLHSHLL
jgi:hypothetical protein